MGGRVIRQYLMVHGDAGLAGINFVASLVVEDPRGRGPRGRDDAVVPPLAVDFSLAAMPHAKVSWFDGCGHSPFAEDAPRFNRELMAFVQSSQG